MQALEIQTQKNPDVSQPTDKPQIALHDLVKRLQESLLPETVDRKSIIINDIDPSIHLDADQNLLAFIIGSMMSNAVISTNNSCIHVDSIPDETGFQIRVRNNGVFIYSSVMRSLGNIADAARQINGRISLSDENRSIAVVLSMGFKNAA